MFHSLRRFRPVIVLATLGTTASAAHAVDTVVPNNQIVQGFQCVGALCVDGEPFLGPTLMSKSDDTPGLRLVQTAVPWGAQIWDVSGNETNFFIRDSTINPVRLPFRIRPGAPTSSIDIAANGEVSMAGVVQQDMRVSATGAVNGADVLIALRGLDVSQYGAAGAVHAAPAAADFRTAFGLGASDAFLAPMDVAAIALAGVKALDARVTDVALTPGPTGETGVAGATGATGATGAVNGSLTAATARIAALEKSNRRLARLLRTLQRQVAAFTRSGGATSSRSATGAAANGWTGR